MRTIDFSGLPFETIQILRSLTTNIVNHEFNEKIRRVKTTHPKVAEHIMAYEVAKKILHLCGFTIEGEYFKLSMEADLTTLKLYQKKIAERFGELKKKQESGKVDEKRRAKIEKLKELDRKRAEERKRKKKEKEEIMKKFNKDREEKSKMKYEASEKTERGPHQGKVHKLKINNTRGG